MRRNFEADFAKCINPAILTIEPNDHKEIWRFVDLFVCEKRKEQTYQDDGSALRKRCYDGFLAERMVERLLNRKFSVLTVGHSAEYDEPDLVRLRLNVGVKAADNDYPLMELHQNGNKKEALRPELICVRRENIMYVCGLAMPDIITLYSDMDLVRTREARGRKLGFYGFEHLIPIHSWEDLIEALKNTEYILGGAI